MFILDGVVNILELQMASLNNYLPGSRKSVPYIIETSRYISLRILCIGSRLLVIVFWKMIELNKVALRPLHQSR